MNSAKINVNTNYYSTNFKQYPPKAITNTIEQSAKAVQNHFKETAAVGAGLALSSLGVISAKPQTDEEAKKMIEDMLLPDKKDLQLYNLNTENFEIYKTYIQNNIDKLKSNDNETYESHLYAISLIDDLAGDINQYNKDIILKFANSDILHNCIFDRMLDIITHIDSEAKQKVFNKGFIILDEKRNVVTVLRNEKDKFSIKDYEGLYTPGFTNKSLYAEIDNVVMENKDLPAYNTLSELNSAINNIR